MKGGPVIGPIKTRCQDMGGKDICAGPVGIISQLDSDIIGIQRFSLKQRNDGSYWHPGGFDFQDL